MENLTILVLTAVGVAAAVALFVLIPRALMSTFRYDLWRIRDELYDQIHDSAYVDDEQPRRLLAHVESSIEKMADVSLASLLVVALLSRSGVAEGPRFNLQAMGRSDRDRIAPLYYGWGGALARRVFLASWSGILVAVPLLVILFISAIWRRASSGDGTHDGTVIKEIHVEFRELASVRVREEFPVGAIHRTERSLASFV